MNKPHTSGIVKEKKGHCCLDEIWLCIGQGCLDKEINEKWKIYCWCGYKYEQQGWYNKYTISYISIVLLFRFVHSDYFPDILSKPPILSLIVRAVF